jgi:hydrogenase maturation protease
MKRGLVVGIGNLLRTDDGLGPLTVSALEEMDLGGGEVRMMAMPQIDITLASLLASVDYAIFVDARSDNAEDEVKVSRCDRTDQELHLSHTSHSLSIPALIEATHQFYGKSPSCFLVTPKGYDFSIGEILSPQAKRNLRVAAAQVIGLIDRISESLECSNCELDVEINHS